MSPTGRLLLFCCCLSQSHLPLNPILLSLSSLSLLAPGLQVIYVWQYETNSVIMSKGNWIWGFRAASGRNLQMNLECGKTPCSIHSLVTLPARLSHYEGQRRRNEEKKPRELDWGMKRKGGEDRRMKTENKKGQAEMANTVNWYQ